MADKSTDIAIIGAGLVGSAMALACAKRGFSVALIDREDAKHQQERGYDGRASAIALGSQRVLESVGVWQHITEAEPILHIRVCDQDVPAHVDYHYQDVGEEPFGHIIENRLIRKALQKAVEAESEIELVAPTTCEQIETTGSHAELKLSDGTNIKANLLLVADGKLSHTRKMLGIDVKISEYGQTAMVCTIAHSNPHNGLALERFLPAGPFAMLPMTEGRSNIVWTESDEMAAHVMSLNEGAFIEELQLRAGDYLGDVSLAGPRFTYPLKLLRAAEITRPRIALIGDAAHAIHPIAGQGVNLGYRDVAVMADLITDQAKLGLDIGSGTVLDHYARWRELDITSMASVTDGLNRLFSNNWLPVKLARNIGLSVVNRTKPLKSFLMRDAMGLNGDLPSMMQRKAS
ncbi:MAG: 2-octaprenyl-6-methoxyphenyl hydroxylase [Rickettsiales bacterium]|nr:2-octaprenyl-6-methoxyphenyl hydroxylase [Rickettsiales bacterium]